MNARSPTVRDVRLDVLAAWRALRGGDYAIAHRVYVTACEPPAMFFQSLQLCSALAERLMQDPKALEALIDLLVAEEMRDEIDRL